MRLDLGFARAAISAGMLTISLNFILYIPLSRCSQPSASNCIGVQSDTTRSELSKATAPGDVIFSTLCNVSSMPFGCTCTDSSISPSTSGVLFLRCFNNSFLDNMSTNYCHNGIYHCALADLMNGAYGA